ncbi:MAG: hypothetical protein A2044_08265 [Candidatus Firestonebacteria bacterium GWA2_43_8]|nr:MAG: hypothetical protein A2044_08265 [Candidatus Firestonebacteria bacterium GWA2_43_8]
MRKVLMFFSACLISTVVLSQDAELEKKVWGIYLADMPSGPVSTMKIWKRLGKAYETFYEEKETFVPDAADKERGYVLYKKASNDEVYPNIVPKKEEIKKGIGCFGSAGEQVQMMVLVYPLDDINILKVTSGDLTGPGNKTIPKEKIEINYVKYDYEPEGLEWRCKAKYVMPSNETFGKKRVPRPFWIMIRIPEDAEGGIYKGKLTVSTGKKPADFEYSVEVFPFKIENPGDDYYFSAFTYLRSAGPETLERYIKELAKRDMNVIHGCGPDIVPGAQIDFARMEQNASIMKKYGFKKWVIEMTGLPNAFVDKLKCKYYDAEFNKAYKSMLKQIKDRADQSGWPEIQVMYDEPREEDSDNPRPLARTYWDMENLLKLHNEVGLATVPVYMGDGGGKRHENPSLKANYFELCKLSKYNMTHGGGGGSKKIIEETLKAGNTLYLYNNGFGRFQFGILPYKLGAKGTLQFWFSSGNTLNTAEQFPTSYAVVALDNGTFIPVLRWLRSVEGVHDFWYITMLENAIKKSGNKNSPDVIAGQKILNELKGVTLSESNADGRDSENVSLETLKRFTGEGLDNYRYKIAQLILKLKKQR